MFGVSVIAAAALARIDFDAAVRIYRNVEFVHDHMDSMLRQFPERCVMRRITVDDRLRVVTTMKSTQYALLMKTGDTEIVIKSVDTSIPMMIPSLAMEKGVLRELSNDSLFPRFYDVSPDSSDFAHPSCYYRTLINSFVGLHSLASTQKILSRKNLYLIAARLMEAIQEIHRLGVVHGDIHDENIIVGDLSDPVGSLRIIDFGESRLFVNPFLKSHIEEIIDPSNQTFGRNVPTSTPWEILRFPKSRRDDFYRVANVLLRFVGTSRPSSRSLHPSPIGLEGLESMAYSFCAMVNSRYPAFIELMKEACRLGFQDEPNYAKWSTEFRRLAADTMSDEIALVTGKKIGMDTHNEPPMDNPFGTGRRPPRLESEADHQQPPFRTGAKPRIDKVSMGPKQAIDNPFGVGRRPRLESEADLQQPPFRSERRARLEHERSQYNGLPPVRRGGMRPDASPLRLFGGVASETEPEVLINPCEDRDEHDEILEMLCPSFEKFRRSQLASPLPSSRSVFEIRTGQVRIGGVSSVDMLLSEDASGSCSLSSSSTDSEIVHIFSRLSSSESLVDSCKVSSSPPKLRLSTSPTIMDGLDLQMASLVHGRLSPVKWGKRVGTSVQQGGCQFLSSKFQVLMKNEGDGELEWKTLEFVKMPGAKGSGDSVFYQSIDGSVVIKHIASSRDPLIVKMLETEKAVYSILADLPTGHPLLQYTLKSFEFQYPLGTPDECYARTLVTQKAVGNEVKDFDGRLTPKQMAHVVSEVVEGLRLLHAIGIVHGDIHWKNVMVATTDGKITILDFGRARCFIDEMRNVALAEYTDLSCITRGYLSPFELEHFPAMPRDDVYRAVEMALILTQRHLDRDSCPSRKRWFDDAKLAEEKRHSLIVGPEWEIFMAFHREIIQLEYAEKPEYDKWRLSLAALASA